MKLFAITIVVFSALGFSYGTAPFVTKSEKCMQLSEYFTRALAKIEVLFPKYYQNNKNTMRLQAGVDITNATALDIIICQIADATNMHELFDAIPQPMLHSDYGQFSQIYTEAQQQVSSRWAGYTNMERIAGINLDLEKWRNQMKPGETFKERVDLATLTNFLEVMQVKYGSRWMSLIIDIPDENLLVEDPVDFAKKLYESTTIADVMKFTNLTHYHAGHLSANLQDSDAAPRFTGDLKKRVQEMTPYYYEGIMLIGDLGLLNLKP